MMSFSAEWLALRADADAAARDVGLMAALAADLDRRDSPQLVEIACGTGALSHALRRWAPQSARWRLVDNDQALLTKAAAAQPDAQPRLIDLAQNIEQAVEGADAVVASAFFDLASEAWIDRFIAALPPGACFYGALTYDGVEKWLPALEQDPIILARLAEHMRRDKGFGPSLGGRAGKMLAQKLAENDRRVLVARTPWRLNAARDGALIKELSRGIAQAAAETDPGVAAAAEIWRSANRERVEIGHVDIFAGPRIPARERALEAHS
ncbi:MAG: class I SAM-dependent methyltransferase [Neomegalonema sp.]|nr:class I SAM-dependent methyltransferase [Neomegalonema sp.]